MRGDQLHATDFDQDFAVGSYKYPVVPPHQTRTRPSSSRCVDGVPNPVVTDTGIVDVATIASDAGSKICAVEPLAGEIRTVSSDSAVSDWPGAVLMADALQRRVTRSSTFVAAPEAPGWGSYRERRRRHAARLIRGAGIPSVSSIA